MSRAPDGSRAARRRRTALRALATVGLVLAPATAAAYGTGSADGRSGAARAHEELRELLATPLADEHDRARRLEQVVALGPHAAPEVVRVLSGRVEDLRPGPRRRALLFAALGRWPEERGLQAVLELVEGQPTLAETTAAVGLLGGFATGRGLRPLCALARSLDAAELRHPAVGREVEEALLAILARDELAFGFLGEELRRADAALVERVVAALGRAPSDDAAELLERLLGRGTMLDARVVEALGQQGLAVRRCVDGHCAEAVRPYLSAYEPALRRQAALALGRLGDTRCVPGLIVRLEDPDRRTGAAALWSLRRLSGLGWSPDVARWRLLLETEEVWLDGPFEALGDDLLDADPARARAAAHGLATRSLVRYRTAPRLARAFEHEDPSVAQAACTALARLGGPEALAVLGEARYDARPQVAAAAESAWLGLLAEDGAGPSH